MTSEPRTQNFLALATIRRVTSHVELCSTDNCRQSGNLEKVFRNSEPETIRGHAATEFFIYSAVFLIVVLSAYFTIFFIQSGEISNKEALYIKWFGERFASAANTAMAGQNGFNYTMKFDRLILEKQYRIQFKPSSPGKNAFVFITWESNNATYSFPIGNMSMKAGGCISEVNSPDGTYYEINTSRGTLNFYNDGENLTLAGC